MKTASNDAEARDKLYDLVKDIRIAMMTTMDEDGSLRSRPMYNQSVDKEGKLWFFTKHDDKIEEIHHDRQVNLSYADPKSQTYVSISGTAMDLRDKAKAREHWSEGLRVWFPKGTEDPDLLLICVTPTKGEYWDSPSSTMLHLYGYVKAVATGEPPYEMTEDKKVNLA